MPVVDFTTEELNRNRVIPPSWYLVKITSIGEAPSKAGDSTNYPVDAVIIKNVDTGSEEFAGVPIGGIGTWFFNSKAKSFMTGFMAALGVNVEAGKRYDLNAAAGEEMEIYIENDTYQGRTVNRVNHKYRAKGAAS